MDTNFAPVESKRCRYDIGPFRVYFFDFETGEEIASGAWQSSGGFAQRNGQIVLDTVTQITFVDLRTHMEHTVRGESFAGRRVIVKIWIPSDRTAGNGRAEYLALVEIGRAGWVKVSDYDLPRVKMGTHAACMRREIGRARRAA